MSNAIEIEIDKNIFNEKFLPILDRPERNVFLWGGAGSGKSYAVAQILVVKILSEEGRNILALRKVYSDVEQSLYNIFKQVINSWELEEYFEFRTRPLKIICLANKNEIIFKGASDIEQIKSLTASNGPITNVWLEEATEFSEEDYNQLSTRLRGGRLSKQLISTFNPVNKMHWIKRRTERKVDTYTLHSTCEDNKFIEEAYKKELRRFKEIDPYHYKVYYLGQWGTTGSSYFGANLIDKRIMQIRNNSEYAESPVITETSRFFVYETPKRSKEYVIGVDTAGQGTDQNIAVVMDTLGNQVAVLSVKEDEAEFVDKLEKLGKQYNEALIAVEINFSTYVSNELKRRNYVNQYVRKNINKIKENRIKEYGFRTDKSTRPLMLMYFKQRFMRNQKFIKDKDTLDEMAIFIRDEFGRPAAELGGHDDRVMATAIAIYVLEEMKETTVKIDTRKFEERGEFDDVLEGLEAEVSYELFEVGEEIRVF